MTVLIRGASYSSQNCNLPLRLQTEALVACRLCMYKRSIPILLLLKISEKFVNCIRIKTFEGYDRVVIVVGLAESEGSSGMEIVDDEILELKR